MAPLPLHAPHLLKRASCTSCTPNQRVLVAVILVVVFGAVTATFLFVYFRQSRQKRELREQEARRIRAQMVRDEAPGNVGASRYPGFMDLDVQRTPSIEMGREALDTPPPYTAAPSKPSPTKPRVVFHARADMWRAASESRY
jgi:hypothetical protein